MGNQDQKDRGMEREIEGKQEVEHPSLGFFSELLKIEILSIVYYTKNRLRDLVALLLLLSYESSFVCLFVFFCKLERMWKNFLLLQTIKSNCMLSCVYAGT